MNDQLFDAISAAIGRIHGLTLVRIAVASGRVSAVFEYQLGTYFKYFHTGFYTDPSQLLSTVLDTLEHLQIDREIDMNIFSADMFEYLCAEMLPTDGRTVSLTIKDTEQDTVAGPRGEQSKVIVSFVERPKKLILNKTNARTLARALGPETDNWRGATVMLGVESVKVGRNTVPSIRVKSASAARRQAPQAPQRPNANGAAVSQPQVAAQDDLFAVEPEPVRAGSEYQD